MIDKMLELFKMQNDLVAEALRREEQTTETEVVSEEATAPPAPSPTVSISPEGSRLKFGDVRRMLDYNFDLRGTLFADGTWTAVKIGRDNTIAEQEFRSVTGLDGPIDVTQNYFYSCSTIADKLGLLGQSKQRDDLRYSLQGMMKKGTIRGKMIGGKWRYLAEDIKPLVAAAKEANARSNVLILDNFRTAAKEIK